VVGESGGTAERRNGGTAEGQKGGTVEGRKGRTVAGKRQDTEIIEPGVDITIQIIIGWYPL